MRRDEIITGTKNLLIALEKTDVLAVLEPLIGKASEAEARSIKPMKMILESYKKWGIESINFTSIEKELIKIFKIDFLNDDEFWQSLTSYLTDGSKGAPRGKLVRYWDAVRFTQRFLPNIIGLFGNKIKETFSDPNNLEVRQSGKDLLTVILIEDDHQFSTPKRLTKLLDSVEKIYNACSELNDKSYDPLSVTACDSGSDKSFDFLGTAKSIWDLKAVIIDVFQKIAFMKEKSFEQKLKLVTQSLPILEKIDQMKTSGNLSPEKAEILKNNIFDGINGFLETGATIPEMQEHSFLNVRMLMAPQQKLLVAPVKMPLSSEENDVSERDKSQLTEGMEDYDTQLQNNNHNALSEEEQRQLDNLLKKRGSFN